MSENQENKNSIIESYDGDPDDLVFFQPPETEDEDYEGYEDYEELEEEVVLEAGDRMQQEQSQAGQSVVMNVATEKLTSHMAKPKTDSVSKVEGNIDLNDPHYANFEWDPYYDFGYGKEPEAKGMHEKKGASTLGIVSFCTGIGSTFLMCCGMQYVLSLAAIVTGIWCLCMKGNAKSTKVFAIIGIICACLPYVFLILSAVFQIALPLVMGY